MLKKHLLPRPDGKCQIDDPSEGDDVYCTTQLGWEEAAGFIRGSDLEFSHYGKFLPTTKERELLEKDSVAMPNVCTTTRVEISPMGSPLPLAVCEGNQVLWVADTGCGSNLVPESDAIRGVS